MTRSPLRCRTCTIRSSTLVQVSSSLSVSRTHARPRSSPSTKFYFRHCICRLRRRVDVSYDPSMVTALQHGTWMDAEGFQKACIEEKKKREGTYQPFYDTWVANFMLRQDAGRFMLEKYLSDQKIPWQRRRRLGMAVAGNTPTDSFLTKIGKMQSAGCRLC